jgi:type I restriction enzyme M protein
MNNIALTADVNSKVNLVKSIANKTRGPYTPEKYGSVIIPMAIIRRFDCILADKNAAIEKILQAASKVKGMTPDKLEEMVKRQCGVPFYNAKCVSLEQLVGDSDNLNANFLEFIAAYSPSIQRILQSLKFREEVEFMIKKGILFEVVKAFSEVDFHPDTTSPMAMGYIFEEIIRRFSEAHNEDAGQHYTPREVIQLMVNILFHDDNRMLSGKSVAKTIYDPACGTGGMLTSCKDFITQNNKDIDVVLYGQEIVFWTNRGKAPDFCPKPLFCLCQSGLLVLLVSSHFDNEVLGGIEWSERHVTGYLLGDGILTRLSNLVILEQVAVAFVLVQEFLNLRLQVLR